jgi:large subunit ribosomal protein L31e
MADAKITEREYVIPLKRKTMKVPNYKRSAKSVKVIKEFIAKHMRVPDRDTSKVKLDVYLNNEIWFRGVRKPPGKVRVKAKRDGEVVRVDFVDEPEVVKFAKARHSKLHKKSDVKKETKVTDKKKEEKKEGLEDKMSKEKTDEEKKAEDEKTKSVEKVQTKIAEQQAKAQKHITSSKGGPQIQRKALKK